VVKDDALAAGKGVLVTEDLEAARAHARACGTVVIEEFLDGPEVSLFAVTDGTTAVPLLPAQDFKRAGDGDSGPNTGGMGAYAPLGWAPPGLATEVLAGVIQPAIDEMRRRGSPYRGLLYAGLSRASGCSAGSPPARIWPRRGTSPTGPRARSRCGAAGNAATSPKPPRTPGCPRPRSLRRPRPCPRCLPPRARRPPPPGMLA